MVNSVVIIKKGQFWVVFGVVKEWQFWVVLSLIKKNSFGWLLVWG